MRCNKASETKVINCDSRGAENNAWELHVKRADADLSVLIWFCVRPAEVHGKICAGVATQDRGCLSTGWRSLDQCHCRELRFKRSLMRELNYQEFGFLEGRKKQRCCFSELCLRYSKECVNASDG